MLFMLKSQPTCIDAGIVPMTKPWVVLCDKKGTGSHVSEEGRN